jgi:hypothetical protein
MSSQLPGIALVMPIDLPRTKIIQTKDLRANASFKRAYGSPWEGSFWLRLGVRGPSELSGYFQCSELGGMNWQVSVKPRLRIPDLKFVKRAWR